MLRPPFSIWILLGLLAVFGASCAMFWVHVRRWTGNQHWRVLREWSNRNAFRLYPAKQAKVPETLNALSQPAPRALVALSGRRRRTELLQMETTASTPAAQPQRWNVLVREIGTYWPTTALRPSTHERSLVDPFRLQSFPALLSGERYTIHGADAPAARAVVGSMLMALLPHDLGLILHGRTLILDFSTRPFDGIELSRLVALAEQLAGHLPAVGGKS